MADPAHPVSSQTDAERFRLLVDAVTDYAIFMLDSNGFVESWNTGAARLTGYTAEEIIGLHHANWFTPEDRERNLPMCILQSALNHGRHEDEGWRVRKDGTRFWASIITHKVQDSSGQHLGFVKVMRDVTKRRNIEIILEKTRTRLAQAQKMEILGQLTSGVAHDFNNLLMVVSGFVPTIKNLLAENPRGLKAAEAIEAAAQRGATLTRQLLSLSRRQSFDLTVVKLGEIVDAMRPILGGLLGGAVNYVPTILPEVWPVRVDASELEVALVNLTVNARDAMSRGGTVSITAENTNVAPRGPDGNDLRGEFVALTVADTGDGIPPDVLAHVFDPFFTTKPEGKGTGLGLSQVHGFMHQSGGTIAIASEMGRGTRVTMYFPRATEEAPAQARTGPGGAQQVTGQRVLVVEDNPDVAAVTREMLIQAECAVVTVSSVSVALEMIETAEFDLVLSDIVMAGPMNGLDFAHAIRDRHPTLPVILATGYAEAAAKAAKMFTVLRKPFGIEDLNRALAEASVVDEREILDGGPADEPGTHS
jgi:PAS domain S-box-containing protein